MISWTDLLTRVTLPVNPLRYSFRQKAPQVIVWNVTARCNLSCKHCYSASTDKGNSQELSKKEAKDFIDDLANFGVKVILFSGGEPLLRQDIFELGRFAKDKGISAALSTNGILIRKTIAERIKNAGLSYVGISLDGTEKTHDTFRQTKGAFSSSLSAMRNCQERGLKVGLRFTLTKYNFKDLQLILDLVEKEKIPRLCIYHLVYAGRGVNLKDRDLNHKEKKEVLEILWQRTLDFFKKGLKIEVLTVDNHTDGVWIYLRLRKTNPRRAKRVLELLEYQGGNGSGVKIGAVDDSGNIYADQFLRTHSLGNIRKQKFSEVWQCKNNDFLAGLRDRRVLIKGRCKMCNFFLICNGNLRARAEAVFDDVWAEDPGCYLTDKEIYGSDKTYTPLGCIGVDA